MAEYYLSVTQVAELIGVHTSNIDVYKMPPPDAYIGDRRGWCKDTIVRWNANRPGHGGRPAGGVPGSGRRAEGGQGHGADAPLTAAHVDQ